MTRQDELVNAAKAGESHGAAFGMSEKVIQDAAEAKVNVVESTLNLNVAKEKVKKSGAGEGFANAAISVINKMEGWFSKRHAANEANAAGRISKAEQQRQIVHKLAEDKANKFARQEKYKAAKAQFDEVSPKGITLALPELPNVFKEVSQKYHEWRVKANESKAEIYTNKATRLSMPKFSIPATGLV